MENNGLASSRPLFYALSCVIVLTSSSAFADRKIIQQLRKLDPLERLEQTCDIEAMRRIGKDNAKFKPDKVIAYSFGDTVHFDNGIKAPGAVFRSGGEWYRLSFTCKTGPQHIKVREFSYRIGSMVDRESWSKHYLYD